MGGFAIKIGHPILRVPDWVITLLPKVADAVKIQNIGQFTSKI
jgi:hypothetical protein